MNYKETTVTGTKWKRCAAVNINNPLPPASATVNFNEQEVILIGTDVVAVGNDNLYATFNPSAMIDLIDPTTLEPTGQQVPEGMVYLALFSRYMACARERDTKAEALIPIPMPIPDPSGQSGYSGYSGVTP